MTWTIAFPSSGKRARKEFQDCVDVTDYRDTHIFLEETQPLSDNNSLTLELLAEILREINSPPHPNAFLLPGSPIHPTSEEIPLDGGHWYDSASIQHQLDLDFISDGIGQESSLRERNDVALEALPFLKGAARIVTLSSGAGLPMVGKKNYPKRLNLRVWVQTDRPYTGEELSHYYAEWIQAGYVDGGLFQPNRRCYVQHPKLINTPCALEGAEWIRCYEGEPLKVSNLNSSYKKINSSNKTCKISNKKRDTDPKEVALMKETIKNSNREALPKLLEEWAETGVLDGNRNALFPWLFQREAFFYSGDTARLAMMLEERPAVLGDRQRWLKSAGKWAEGRTLANLRQDAQIWAARNPEQVIRFDEIDLSKRNWEELKNLRSAAIKSGCGTNKTKGVIYDLVEWAKQTEQSALIITPFIAVTEEIAQAVDIRHYHTFGIKRSQRKQALTSSVRIATCAPSLLLYEGIDDTPEFDIVIIDEASIVFRGMDTATVSWGWMDWLFKICDHSKHIYAFDADIDSHTLWCLEQIRNHQPEQFALYMNAADWGKDYEIDYFHGYEQILADLIASINAGKKVALALDVKDSNGAIRGFGKFLEHYCPNIVFRGYDAQTVTTELKTDADRVISEWLEDGLNCLALSPWAAVGWDYIHDTENFDEVYVLGTVGFLEATRVWQWIRRFRLTRKAKVFLNSPTNPPFTNAVENTISYQKGITAQTREDAWKVRTKQRKELDVANPGWWFRELCRDKRADLVEIPASEEEETPLSDHLKETRKAVKDAIAAELSASEERREILESYRRWTEVGFIEPKHVTDKQLLALRNRTEKLNERQADRICRILAADKEERAEMDDEEILEFNVAMGNFYDACWLVLGELVDIDQFSTVAHWFMQSKDAEIFGQFEDIDFGPIQKVINNHYYALKDHLSVIGKDTLVEPQRVLRPFAQSLDLSFSTKKNDDLPDEYKDFSAKEARDALFHHYDETKPRGYNERAKLTPKLKFCVSHILKKQKQGETLNLQERVFMASRPQSFVIRRKQLVHKKWVEAMERARNETEDKLGANRYHTRFCRCDICSFEAVEASL